MPIHPSGDLTSMRQAKPGLTYTAPSSPPSTNQVRPTSITSPILGASTLPPPSPMNPMNPSDETLADLAHQVHLAGVDREKPDESQAFYSQAAGSRNIPRVLSDGSLSYMDTHPTPPTIPESETPDADAVGDSVSPFGGDVI